MRRPAGFSAPQRLSARPRGGCAGLGREGNQDRLWIVKNCSKTTLQAITEGRVRFSAEINTDGFRSYDGLVEAGFKSHHRVNKF